jgi:hypothetical protein
MNEQIVALYSSKFDTGFVGLFKYYNSLTESQQIEFSNDFRKSFYTLPFNIRKKLWENVEILKALIDS